MKKLPVKVSASNVEEVMLEFSMDSPPVIFGWLRLLGSHFVVDFTSFVSHFVPTALCQNTKAAHRIKKNWGPLV